MYCGTCDVSCGANATCVDGFCACKDGFEVCNSEYACFDVQTDEYHCGADCIACHTLAGASGSCTDGACDLVCGGGLEDCDGDWRNGCEASAWANPQHCGACNNSCLNRANAVSGYCLSEACVLECASTHGNCDNTHTNGCEVDLRNNAQHCGACNFACAVQPHVVTGTCSAASCTYTCASGWGNCTSAPGCETQLGTDNHCAACGNQCDWGCEGSACDDGVAVAPGMSHACAIRESGRLVCWGANTAGQIGDGTMTQRPTPVPVSSMASGVTSVGNNHTCAVQNGAARCWGDNTYGQLGVGSTTDQDMPVTVSNLSSGVAAIAVGAEHSCALLTSGYVRCWGYNEFGQLGDGTATQRNTPNPPVPGLVDTTTGRRAIAIAAGGLHTCALLSDATIRCWGQGSYAQIGNGQTSTVRSPVQVLSGVAVSSIATGGHHTCARTTAGAVYCWGDNTYGQLGDGTYSRRSSPTLISSLSSPDGPTAGAFHTCARTSGNVRCWGNNQYGSIGDGTVTNRPIPTLVPSFSGVTALSAGGYNTCAVLSGGAVRCWGWNAVYQVGDGTRTNRPAPTPVAAP
ncbi:hypothetical protein [Sandaracinus amylolyticus]|uniref:RCC1 domain-containing protein n=1 Tax=Sandaracinus amylolyticus TaxID=927083 RepID=UPI001F2D236B|nr:hypothetical protein [Sandaracinus amylolyticus]UJR84876.1 Hypothetical protein I5071_69550 [Sandaracinus amylolyticus]